MRTTAARAFPTEADFARVDEAAGRRPELPVEQLHIEPPSYGAEYGKAIESLTLGMARELVEQIKANQKRLAELEQQALARVAEWRHDAEQTLEALGCLKQEADHISGAVDRIARMVAPRHV